MGTRHLTMVVHNDTIKLAQYGQWDGYPEGQGQTVVDFLNLRYDKETFIKNLNSLQFLTDDELDEIQKDKEWSKQYPQMSRDMGADILNAIQGTENLKVCKSLSMDTEFVKDSLFCEYAYLLNLDKDVLEVYKGFNEQPISETERFYNGENNGEYYPIKLWFTVPFSEIDTFFDVVKKNTTENE